MDLWDTLESSEVSLSHFPVVDDVCSFFTQRALSKFLKFKRNILESIQFCSFTKLYTI